MSHSLLGRAVNFSVPKVSLKHKNRHTYRDYAHQAHPHYINNIQNTNYLLYNYNVHCILLHQLFYLWKKNISETSGVWPNAAVTFLNLFLGGVIAEPKHGSWCPNWCFGFPFALWICYGVMVILMQMTAAVFTVFCSNQVAKLYCDPVCTLSTVQP